MSIVTGSGDGGMTDLGSGSRVPKDDMRIEALGTVDELDSHLGAAKHLVRDGEARRIIVEVQHDLFRLAGELACPGMPVAHPVTAGDTERLTGYVHRYEAHSPVTGFIVPGATPAAAALDIARTVTRRLERRIVTLDRRDGVPPELLRYLNRLSDLLFVIARGEEPAADPATP